MADYYWVGGNGDWTNISTSNGATTNWASYSGGPGGAGWPTSTDNVHFDVNSGSAVVSMRRTTQAGGAPVITVNNMDCTGFTGSFTGSDKNWNYLNLNGDLTLGVGNNINSGIQISLTNAVGGVTQNITSNGSTTGVLFLNGSPTTTYKFLDNFSTAIAGTGTGYQIGLYQGILDANDKNITTEFFQVLGTSAKSILMGSGTWTLAGGAPTGTNVWCGGGGTNVTSIDGSKATIQTTKQTGAGKTFYLFGATYNKIILGGASGAGGEWRFYGGGTINELSTTKQAPFNLVLDTAAALTVNRFMVSGYYNNESALTHLVSDIDNTQTTGIVSDWWVAGNTPPGPPVNYPTSGTIRIDDEVISYTGYTAVTGGYEFTGVTRHVNGTAAASHTHGASIYSPYRFSFYSTTSGTQATLNTTTTSGLFRVGNNSTNNGNNLGITFTSGSELDYLNIQDINVVTTSNPRGNYLLTF